MNGTENARTEGTPRRRVNTAAVAQRELMLRICESEERNIPRRRAHADDLGQSDVLPRICTSMVKNFTRSRENTALHRD